MTGRVQGVFYRDSTRSVANHLNLAGYAINLPDGSVEVCACGGGDSIDQLREWLHQGPKLAVVAGVVEIESSCSEPDRFITA